MTGRPLVVFLNLRRTPLEHRAALNAAHRLGYQVALLADAVPAGLPAGIVVHTEQVPTMDPLACTAAVRALAAEHDVAAVVTWSDAAVESVSAVAAELGLRAVSAETAATARNKHTMRTALAKVRPDLSPGFVHVTGVDAIAAAAAEVGYPVIVKPVSGNGSKGIWRLDTEADAQEAAAHLDGAVTAAADPIFAGHEGELIVEQFLAGSEHSVEGFVHDGVVSIAGITDKRTSEPHRLELGHIFPTGLGADAVARVSELTASVVQAFGMENGTFHLECIVGPDGVARMVECAARVGGDFITSHLVGLATGRSFCENVLLVATGQRPVLAPPTLVAGVRKVLAPRAGTLRAVGGVDEALRVPGVEHVVLERAIGAAVQLPPQDVMSCFVGAVIATGPTAAEVERSLDEAERRLDVVVDGLAAP